MLDEYLLCLYKQYCEAKGIEPLPVKVYPTQFLDWISENNYLLEDYMEYLHCLGFDYAKENTIEVGKGIFDSLKDPKVGEITPEILAKIAAEIGDELNEQDLKKILQTISGSSPSINITQDEFYYIMTKKPEDAFKINMATKKM